MHPQEFSRELPAQGARRATGEGSTNRWQHPQRLSARQKTEVVLRLLRGEPLELGSRALGIPAARLTTWREAFLAAGHDALKKPPLEGHDRELTRLHQTLGEATRDMELLHEKIGRLETHRP